MPFGVSYGPIKVGNRAEASAAATRPSEPRAQESAHWNGHRWPIWHYTVQDLSDQAALTTFGC